MLNRQVNKMNSKNICVHSSIHISPSILRVFFLLSASDPSFSYVSLCDIYFNLFFFPSIFFSASAFNISIYSDPKDRLLQKMMDVIDITSCKVIDIRVTNKYDQQFEVRQQTSCKYFTTNFCGADFRDGAM